MKRCLLLFLFLIGFLGIKAQSVIEMRKEASGVYTVPCKVNGLNLRFVFDTGASAVSISLTEASFMLKNGYLKSSDVTGVANVQTADGEVAENYTININELEIGPVTLRNVKAVVSSGLDAPLLLGQSVLDRLGTWSIKDSKLVLNEVPSYNDTICYSLKQIEEMIALGNKDTALSLLRDYVYSGDYEAARLLLSEVAESNQNNEDLLEDPGIVRAMNLLADTTSQSVYDIYLSYDKLIWFSLYRLKSIKSALMYFRLLESMGIHSLEVYDEFAADIVLNMGFSPTGICDNFIRECFEKGYLDACCRYALHLKERKKLVKRAFQIYQECAKKGSLVAMHELGLCYLEAVGTEYNKMKGVEFLDRAARRGYISAVVTLCRSYYFGYYGLEQDYDKVIHYAQYFDVATDAGLMAYNAYLGVALFAKEDYSIAYSYLKQVELMPQDRRPSKNLLNALNTRGVIYIYPQILYAFGRGYENGLDGCEFNPQKAYDFYTKLVKYDSAWGNASLGDMFFINELIESDYLRAYNYYKLGANNNDAYCYYRLALMNYYGVGIEKNQIRALEYKNKAIKLGISADSFSF